MPDISRITMPSGTTYDIKDSVARQMASGFRYTLSTDAATTPAGVQWKSGTTTITGTLVASSETVGIFYLVPSMKSAEGDKDIYDEYITIEKSAGVYDWEKIGNTQIDIGNLGDLAFKNSVALDKKTDVVLGEATTFTNGTSNVSFSGGTTASVIGANATFTVTQPTIGVTTEPTITVTPTTTNIKATASGTAVQVATSAAAITGITPSEDSVSAITSVDTLKMVTTSITGTNGTVDVPNVTNVGSAPTLGTAFKIKPPSLGTAIPADDITAWSAGSASNWSFTVASETLTISGGNGTAPSLSYTAKSIPNVSLGTELTIPNVTNVGSAPTLGTAIKCAKVASSATTVATGSLAADGAGSAVVTDVAYDDISVLTGLGTPSTDTFAKTVSVKTQPTISLATGATAGTGVISVATGITSATATGGAYSATGGNVAWNSKDSKTVVATIGTATAAAQTITVGTNDKVTVLKSDTGVTVS